MSDLLDHDFFSAIDDHVFEAILFFIKCVVGSMEEREGLTFSRLGYDEVLVALFLNRCCSNVALQWVDVVLILVLRLDMKRGRKDVCISGLN